METDWRQNKRRHWNLVEDDWLFLNVSSRSNSKADMGALNAATGEVYHPLHTPHGGRVVASMEDRGLLCILASNGMLCVWNPVTDVQDEIDLGPYMGATRPATRGPGATDDRLTVTGGPYIGATSSGTWGGYTLCNLCFSDHSTVSAMLYDSNSAAWKQGSSYALDTLKHGSWKLCHGDSRVYLWTTALLDQGMHMVVVAYDMLKDEWNECTRAPLRWVDIDECCNQSENFPSLVVCDGVPYYVGRDGAHDCLMIYRALGQKLSLEAKLLQDCSNSCIKYASSGSNIYALQNSSQLLKYDLRTKLWCRRELRKALGFEFGVTGLTFCRLAEVPQAWKKLQPSRVPSGIRCLLASTLNNQHMLLRPQEDQVEMLKLADVVGEGRLAYWFAASLGELGIFCLLGTESSTRLQVPFPEKIYVGNLARWEPVTPCLTTEEVAEENHQDSDREFYRNEFIGVSMHRHLANSGACLLCYFYRQGDDIKVQIYDSGAKAWKVGSSYHIQDASTLKYLNPKGSANTYGWRSAHTYGWRCTGSYVYSSETCYLGMSSPYPFMLRVLCYNQEEDRWDKIAWKQFPSRMQVDLRYRGLMAKTLVDIQGNLFVVGKSDPHTLEIRDVEKLTLVAELPVVGSCFVVGDSEAACILVAIFDKQFDSPLHKSRIMVYDFSTGLWRRSSNTRKMDPAIWSRLPSSLADKILESVRPDLLPSSDEFPCFSVIAGDPHSLHAPEVTHGSTSG